jgi:hypothetical protein
VPDDLTRCRDARTPAPSGSAKGSYWIVPGCGLAPFKGRGCGGPEFWSKAPGFRGISLAARVSLTSAGPSAMGCLKSVRGGPRWRERRESAARRGGSRQAAARVFDLASRCAHLSSGRLRECVRPLHVYQTALGKRRSGRLARCGAAGADQQKSSAGRTCCCPARSEQGRLRAETPLTAVRRSAQARENGVILWSGGDFLFLSEMSQKRHVKMKSKNKNK